MSRRAPAWNPYPAYFEAFAKLLARIDKSLKGYSGPAIPVYVAGGAALHLYTGARFSDDIDASIEARIAIPADLSVAYKGPDGRPRTLYFDTQYNESFALLHDDVHRDSIPIEVPGVDPSRLDVRLFSPVDLAVSKLARFEQHDREDIRVLADAGLIDANGLRRRAEEALPNYVGDVQRLKTSIKLACQMIAAPRGARDGSPKKRRR